MKVTLPIATRRYGDELVIATVLDDLSMSAAAGSVDEAIEKLRTACIEALERAHPRLIARLGRLARPRVERVELPIFRRRGGYSSSEEEGSRRLARPVDVYWRFSDGLVQLESPLTARSVWIRCEDDESLEDARDRGLERLGEILQRQEPSLALHRPGAERTEVRDLAIEFAPLDLSRMPSDTLWLDAFAEIDADADDDRSEETQILAEVARPWTLDDRGERRERGLVPAFERDELAEQIAELLFASRPSAVVLVGPARVGKTSLVKHIAWRTATRPEEIGERELWFADAPRLTSTDPMSGGWQKQCAELVEELERADDLLYVGSLVQALDAGKYVGSDYNLAQFLKPHLSDRRLRIVGEATVEEWNRIEQRDAGFARNFNVVRVDDPPEATARLIVGRAAERLSRREGIAIDEEAVDRAWRLERRFATEGSPVGGAIDFIERTLRRAAQAFEPRIEALDLVENFCEETGLPPVLLLDDRKLDLEEVQDRLARRVMGQQEAVRRIAHVVGITKAGLAPADRPLGSFFFVGPTGVGKTELARALAEFLFSDEERLIRLDMSEYSHPNAYGRLVGEGSEEGDLTEPVRRQPFSVVLLDEIEKAHQSVFDLLLQVLGEARLTDARGRTTRFQNTIVIMTSNLGVDTLKPSIGFGQEATDEAWERHFRGEAERHFRPEFLARIDQFVPFGSLSREVIEAIARRELEQLVERDGLSARDIAVDFDDDVIRWVAHRGWDEQYGARPIKRVVEQEVAWPMSGRLATARASNGEEDHRRPALIRVAVDGGAEDGALTWSISEIDDDRRSRRTRRALLAQVEEIARLRRRLERCTHEGIFAELEWTVHDFDTTSQAEGFWELPEAPEVAREAERARELVASVYELGGELEAIEDLVREAYHTRSFDLTGDIDERVDEIEPRLNEVVLELLRSAYEDPDHVVLFLPSTDPRDEWREQLVRWYRQLAGFKQWKLDMRRSAPRNRRTADLAPDERRESLWDHARKPSGHVLALEFRGRGVRPLLAGEDGLHRRIGEKTSDTAEVLVWSEGLDWPRPSRLESERPRRPTARVYNCRTHTITARGFEGIAFDEERPWEDLWPHVEEIAWELAGDDWW